MTRRRCPEMRYYIAGGPDRKTKAGVAVLNEKGGLEEPWSSRHAGI